MAWLEFEELALSGRPVAANGCKLAKFALVDLQPEYETRAPSKKWCPAPAGPPGGSGPLGPPLGAPMGALWVRVRVRGAGLPPWGPYGSVVKKL